MNFGVENHLLCRIRFVHRQKKRLAAPLQELREFHVRSREFGPAIDHHYDGDGLIQCNPRLAEDFRRDKFLVIGNDAAGIDHAEIAPPPLGLTVEAVASDAGLVADNGAPRTRKPVEER